MAESKRSEIVLRRDKMETHRRVRSALMNGWFAGSTMMTYLLSYNTVMLRLLAGRFDCDAPFGILFASLEPKPWALDWWGNVRTYVHEFYPRDQNAQSRFTMTAEADTIQRRYRQASSRAKP